MTALLASILFLLLHSTATLSVRTHLFITGHPLLSLTSKIEMTDIYDKQYERQYEVVADIKDGDTGNSFSSLKVKKFGFLYFAKYGEA